MNSRGHPEKRPFATNDLGAQTVDTTPLEQHMFGFGLNSHEQKPQKDASFMIRAPCGASTQMKTVPEAEIERMRMQAKMDEESRKQKDEIGALISVPEDPPTPRVPCTGGPSKHDLETMADSRGSPACNKLTSHALDSEARMSHALGSLAVAVNTECHLKDCLRHGKLALSVFVLFLLPLPCVPPSPQLGTQQQDR